MDKLSALKEKYEQLGAEIKKLEDEKKLPERIEDIGTVDGWYMDNGCLVCRRNSNCCVFGESIYPTSELALATDAIRQLSFLRQAYWGGWRPDWENTNKEKFVIRFVRENIVTDMWTNTSFFLTFQTPELRDKFLSHFRSLIEQAKPLL